MKWRAKGGRQNLNDSAVEATGARAQLVHSTRFYYSTRASFCLNKHNHDDHLDSTNVF